MINFRNIIFVLVAVIFILQIITSLQDTQKNTEPIKPLIALSTFSLYDIAKHISGESVDMIMILPFGVDAHSFEPTPKLMTDIFKSDLVVYSGAGLEPWIDGFEFKNRVVDMSTHVDLREIGTDEHEHHIHHDDQCAHNKIDPHYWLDIQNMIKATNIIREELIKILPTNKELYEKNALAYITMLESLDNEYEKKLSSCQKDTIIVNHNAFSYISSKYNFHVEALSGLSPDSEPTPKDMIRVIEHVNEHKVSTIFFESFVSDRAIRSIANEVNVDVEVLQPLGNITEKEAKQNLSYEDIMKDNLRKIAEVLECR